MSKNISVPALARVEGEGAIFIGVEKGEVQEVRVDIYEPPRFFEGFLRDRYLQDVPDITARICGICPVAYQMSSVRALEMAMGVEVTPEIHALRDLLYCAEYIESHVLHVFMLQAPDLTGHESALTLAEDAPEKVQMALRMKKLGNQILKVIGGRSVHPVNARVGGWYSWPKKQAIRDLIPELEWALENIVEAIKWAAGLPFPEFEVEYEYVALHRKDQYAILDGDIMSSKIGLIKEKDFEKHYLEKHIEHSNALHSYAKDGQPYMVGPLARFNLNHEQLAEKAQSVLNELGLSAPISNPYKSLLARGIELVEVIDRAINLARQFDPQGEPFVDFEPKSGSGAAASEAPRGLLYHRYKVDAKGMIKEAKIVPPTAQNLGRMEADLWKLAPKVLQLPHEQATLECEHLIRSYDPCISCATHFLELTIEEN